MTMAPGARSRRITVVLPWAAAVVAFVTIAVGLYVRRVLDEPIGLPYTPLVGSWNPQADPLVVVTMVCFAAAVLLAPRLLALPGAAFAVAMFVLTLVLRLALAAGGGGTEQWSAVLDVTLNGTFRKMRAALRHMMQRRSGSIVNNASVLGWRAQAGQAHYASTTLETP